MTDTRVLILHGFENRRPRGHWQWWLAERLRLARVPVLYPQLPAPEAPRLGDWARVARAELAMLGDGERVVIAHSLGGILWLQVAGSLDPGLRVDRVLLVAPPHPDRLTGPLAGFALDGVDVAAAARAASSTLIVARDSDPYRPASLDGLATQWGLPAVTLPGVGHLNPDDGHGPWESVARWAAAHDPAAVEWRLGEGARSLDA